ncbi:hypothetical protein [Acinetobacter indicus]|uniref:hypothetical protein n=1 Tax=Acinetobacter indicus TaxID=756892 RepID=UPI000CEC352D|nr:hypothetical protein [Acinetobacter indicus]
MAVQEQMPYKEYTANGSTTSFALGFKCKDKAHLIVKLNDENASVNTWTLSNDTVVFSAAPASGTKLFLQRKTPNRRTADYQSFNNSFNPAALNEDLDTLWLRLQEEEASKFLLNQLINMNYEDLDKKGQSIRTELIGRLTMQADQLNSQIIQQGVSQQQLRTYYAFLLNQMANLSSNKNWIASLIADASGKSQQEINNLTRLIEVSPEHFGYVSGDATQAFKAAALYAKENNVPFVAKDPNGYLITQTVYFYTDTNISKVIMPADGTYRYLVLDTLNTPTEITSGLSGLTELSKVVTGFPVGSAGKYVKIESLDVLTERNNAPSNTPYTKSTAFKILSPSGDISPSLDMSFTGAYTAKIYPPESKIDFRLGSFETVGSGENLNGIIIERNSVDAYINTASSETQFRTIVNLRGCDINFYSPVLNNADYAGYGYGISIGLCCDINIYSMQSGRCRAGLDGRHGANVTVYNSRLERAGTHWGNNYKFIDCDIERVLYSGKDLSVQGGFVKDAVHMRHDIAMCIGTLDIKDVATDCSTVFIEPSALIASDFFSTPRRFFDIVKTKNITFNKNPIVVFGHSTTNQFGADFIPPHTFDFSDFYASETQRLYLIQMNLANAVISKKGVVKVSNINLKDGGHCVPFSARTTVKFPATTGYAVTVRDVGKFFIQADADTFTEYKAFDSHFIGANRFVSKTALGRIDLNGCKVDHDATVATLGQWRINSNKSLINCEYVSNFVEQVSSGDGVVEYAVGCVAKAGVTGFKPVPYYVDPVLYQVPTP